MANFVADAIEIITDTGLGIVSTYTNTAVGLASDGHFYLITDRFNLVAGDGHTITGDTTRTTWYEGILTRDFGSFSISRSADFVEAGCMESVSGFQFSVVNTAAFFNTLAANGIYLSRCRVKYYRVTSPTGSASGTFTFTLRWSGIIDDQPFNELTQSIKCIDNSKDIFKSVPTVPINKETFEDAPNDSLDKMVPIVIGKSAYSPLVNVTGSGKLVDLVIRNGITYQTAASSSINSGPTAVTLVTQGINFQANDIRLVGKYLSVVAGGEAQSVLILTNDATSGSTTDPVNFVTLHLATGLVGGYSVLTHAWTAGNADADTWFFQVIDLSPSLVASSKTIYDVKKNSNGRPGLYIYGTDTKDYEDVSNLKNTHSLSNISSTGYPGYAINAGSADATSGFSTYSGIRPEDIIVVSQTGWTTSDLPAAGLSAPKLFDQLEASGNLYNLTRNTVAGASSIVLDVYLPKSKALKQFDEVYILPNFSHNCTVGPQTIQIEITAQLYDLYGYASETLVNGFDLKNSSLGTSEVTLRTLPRSYFNETGDDTVFYADKASLDISEIIASSKAILAFNRIRVTLSFTSTNPSGYVLKLEELGLVVKQTVSATNETFYAPIVGETYGTAWDGRKTSTDPILHITDAIEHLIRNYDENTQAWRAATAYVIGDRVRATVDNGNIFVATAAGTSHASTEPSWTDTAGATYIDSGVTWKQLRAIPVDTASFDFANDQRVVWYVGRTLTEKKDTEEYITELCKQGFLISFIDTTGKVNIKAWRENITPTVTFDEGNILAGSLGEMILTPMRRVYNDILVRYDYNPGSNGFNKQIAITNIDKPAFPAATDLVSPGTSLGSFTLTNEGSDDGILYVVSVVTGSAHGLSTGDYIYISGNTHGFDIFPGVVGVLNTTSFSFVTSNMPLAASSTTGTLYSIDSFALKWKTYVTGISNYSEAEILWEQCHNSFLISKTVNKLPAELGDCKWFFDNYALDPDGNLIWSSDIAHEVPDIDFGDHHSAAEYVRNLVDWTAWQKKQITFEVSETVDDALLADILALELGDPVYFNDQKLTNGAALLGWVHEITQTPRGTGGIEKLKFGLTLEPEQWTEGPNIIDENGATDIIDENSATNIIDENGA